MMLDLARTFLTAMTPLGELRLSIPLAILSWEVPWYLAFILSVVGNTVPVLFLVPGLDRISRIILSFPSPLGRLLIWRANRLRATQGEKFQRYGALALMIFVAIPLPLTGAWSGALAAWVFQIPPRIALLSIFLGVVIAGVVVTGLTMAGVEASLFLARR